VFQVTKNGLVLGWHPPARDNGGKLDLYQIEMTSEKPLDNDFDASLDGDSLTESFDENSLIGGSIDSNGTPRSARIGRSGKLRKSGSEDKNNLRKGNSIRFTDLSPLSEHSLTLTPLSPFIVDATDGSSLNKAVTPEVQVEKWHRLIKHRNVSVREKYLMGLQPFQSYYFRVRAHNDYGWSMWSEWSDAYTPQEGVIVEPAGKV